MRRLQSSKSLTVCIFEIKLTKPKKTKEVSWDPEQKPTEEKDIAIEASTFFPLS